MPDSSTVWGIVRSSLDWISIHQVLVWWLSVLSLITFFGTLLIIPILVVRIPQDYFLYDKEHLKEYRKGHPLVFIVSLILKNILGILFILVGIAMLFLPGQGILTILIGITFVTFPRKRALELRIISVGSVLKAVNWIRTRAGKPRLRLPDQSTGR